MKRIILLLLVTNSIIVKAQIESPIKWSYGAKKANSQEAVIFLKVTIADGWHIYAQHMGNGGPVRTAFTFIPSPDYALIGETIEPIPISKFESVFNMKVKYFEHSAIFQQKVKLNTGQTVIKGKLRYMSCTDRQCLPPEDVDFNIPIK